MCITNLIYFLKYEDRDLSISFFALAPERSPRDASSARTSPKELVKSPTPPNNTTATTTGTYGGGSSDISAASVSAYAATTGKSIAETAPAMEAWDPMFSVFSSLLLLKEEAEDGKKKEGDAFGLLLCLIENADAREMHERSNVNSVTNFFKDVIM